MADKKHALYLAEPETGRVELVDADNVEEKQKAGWKQPESQRPNGEPWNGEDDLIGQDYAAGFAKEKAEADAKKAEKAEKERQKTEAAQPVPVETPDLKVQVVEAPKKSAKK